MTISVVTLFLLQILIPTKVYGYPNLTADCVNKKRLCFGYPSSCATDANFNCDILIQISRKTSGLDVDIYGKSRPGTYYALGLNRELQMGGSVVIRCDHNEDSTLNVNAGYTVGYRLKDLPADNLVETSSTDLVDGLVHCNVKQKQRGLAGGIDYDVMQPNHVLIAIGEIKSGRAQQHMKRSITGITVNLTSLGIIETGGNSLPWLIRIHGIYMVSSWLSVVSIGKIIARYHKDSWSSVKLYDVKLWFFLHFTMMSFAILGVIVGMSSIFWHVKGWRADTPHQYFGLIANIFMGLQLIGGLSRPAPDSPKRIFFNVLHKTGGYLGHLMAVLALLFVYKIPITLSIVYYIALIAWLVLYLVTHILQQFQPFILSKLKIIESTDMDDLKRGPVNSDQSSSSEATNPALKKIKESKLRVLAQYILLSSIISVILYVCILNGSA